MYAVQLSANVTEDRRDGDGDGDESEVTALRHRNTVAIFEAHNLSLNQESQVLGFAAAVSDEAEGDKEEAMGDEGAE